MFGASRCAHGRSLGRAYEVAHHGWSQSSAVDLFCTFNSSALVRSAPVDDESQWLQWLEDLADQVETASVTLGDPGVVKVSALSYTLTSAGYIRVG